MKVKWKKIIDKNSGETEIVDGVCAGDECNRPSTTLEGLSKLPPAFEENGTVTAGNASQLSDGASMTLIMSETRATELGITPMAYFRGWSVAGCEPDEMGIGPIYAIPKLLSSAGLKLTDIDLIELNDLRASMFILQRRVRNRSRYIQCEWWINLNRASIWNDWIKAYRAHNTRTKKTR